MLAAGSLAFNTFFIFMPNNLIARHGAELPPTLLVTALTLGLAALAAVVLGRLSDRIGRRPVAIGSAVTLAILAPPMSVLAPQGSVLGLFVAEVVISVAVAGVLSIAMVGELFAAPLRSTGFALSAGLRARSSAALRRGSTRCSSTYSTPSPHPASCGGDGPVALFALRRWPETAFRPLD